jgi:dienelactone hydrolase
LALSPDGRFIALFERTTDLAADAYHYALVLVDASGRSPPHILADAGAFLLQRLDGRPSGLGFDRMAQFSHDGAWVYYSAEHEGRLELWRVPSAGGVGEPVAKPDGDVARFALIGHDEIVFETKTPRSQIEAARANDERTGFRVDEALQTSFALTPLPDETSGKRLWLLRLSDRTLAPASPADATLLDTNRQSQARIHPEDASSRAAEPKLGLFSEEASSPASGHQQESQCHAEACSGALQQVWDLPASGPPEIVFSRAEGHAEAETAFYAWRARTTEARLILRSDKVFPACTRAPTTLYCLEEAPLEPRRLVAIDLESGAVRTLYDPNPSWAHLRLPRIDRLDFTDREGNQSFARLVYPLDQRAGQSYPLVVMQARARGFFHAGTGGETPILPLSAEGYFVLLFDRPEFHTRAALATPSQLQRAAAIEGFERSAKREALMGLLDQALAHAPIDRARMAITGTSNGAETAYYMLMDEPNLFAAAVTSTPPTDPIAWPLQSEEFRRQRLQEVGMSAPWGDENAPWTQWWRRSSPFFHADEIQTPLMMNLADAEALRAFPLIERLREASKPAEAYVYPGAFHLKWRPQQILAAQERSIAWIDFWLRGIETSDPSDPDRLTRWRAMRALQVRAHAPPGPGGG